MRYESLTEQIDFLMSAALTKCGNIQEAEDLAQETLLAALTCLAQGKTISNLRGWLLTVLNRKFYDMLRRKYRRPYISIGEDFDIAYEKDALEELSAAQEAETVRRETAYLGRLYREVIVRHYMDGQSIAEIASALHIPEGTVKRRLYMGRDQLRKGITDMTNYTKQSISPVTLHVSNSGAEGLNGGPASLVNGDLMAQNLLWLAYEKPSTVEELSRAIGIPAAYVEPVVEKLTCGELMKKAGRRYYTDFIIYTAEDRARYLPAQKQFAQEHFDQLWNAIGAGLEKIRGNDFYAPLNQDQRSSLELYFSFYCLDHGIYKTFSEIFQTQQIFPDRPDGGKWIAFGHVLLQDSDRDACRELNAYSYSGERWERFENYAGAKRIELHVYGADGFPSASYDQSPDYTFFAPYENRDAAFLKLLYLIHAGIRPEEAGFNTEILRAVPWLVKCKVLRLEDGRPAVNIPVLDAPQARWLWELCVKAVQVMAAELKPPLKEYFQGKEQLIPAHLSSVPLQKRYLCAENALLFCIIREALKRGRLCDGNYDNAAEDTFQAPCPMLLTVENTASPQSKPQTQARHLAHCPRE